MPNTPRVPPVHDSSRPRTCTIPPLLPARGFESSATLDLRPRFDDVAQDGRLQLVTLMQGLGAIWRAFGGSNRLDIFRAQGVLPMLRRLVFTGEPGPFSFHVPIHFSGTWRLARETNGERIFLDMWLDAFAPHGSTMDPHPPENAERVLVGRLYAEHVVTRPFAPPAERKVTRLDLPGIPPVPEDTHPCEEAEDLVAGCTLSPASEHVFGMMHTDPNRHVNSLVYQRFLEEAVVKRMTGAPTLLARATELRFRKPFFAGDRAVLAFAAEPLADAQGVFARGTFVPSGAQAKPNCTIAMLLA